MTPLVPKIAVFTLQNKKTFFTSDEYRWLAKNFEINFFNSKINLDILNKLKFSLIITTGIKHIWNFLRHSNIPVLHLDDLNGDIIYNHYVDRSISDYNPKVSIFTPAHKTYEKFIRCHTGVINQSFKDWEWIILDDSPDDKNYEYIKKIVGNDYRIKVYKSNRQDGFVGSTKRQAASLCSGDYLVELDHDDELHHLALDYIVSAFNKFPDAGFCYSDSCETYESGGNVNYGNYFAMGFGKHYPFKYKGRSLIGSNTPINASTMRHIVGVPNHFRCWKREVYFQIARHNNKLAIVDDYELLIRTFLNTKIIHIPETLYIQYMNAGGNNTQEPRRAEIQRLVNRIQIRYDKQIHERLIELGASDWLWNENNKAADVAKPPPILRETHAYTFKV